MQVAEFKNELMRWLQEHGFEESISRIRCDGYSSFNMDTKEISIGVYDVGPAKAWYEEYLLDNGLEVEDILNIVLQFLHELGHSQTVYDFSEEDLFSFHFIKEMLDPTDEVRTAAFAYWNIEDEKAANQWLINFINSNLDAVIELQRIFIDHIDDDVLNQMIEEAETNALFETLAI